MWNKRIIIVGILCLFIISGCAVKKIGGNIETTKKAVSKAEKKRILTNLEISQLDYVTYSGKAKAKIAFNNKSFNTTMNLRIKHEEVIWISVTAFLGIEVARVLITPSRIKIINRIQGEVVDKPFDYIYGFASKELSFTEVESLLVGNTVRFATNPDFDFYNTLSGFEIEGREQDLNLNLQFSDDYKPTISKLSQTSKNQTLLATYGAFKQIMEQVTPQHIQISLKAPKVDLDADIQYNSINLNEDLSFPFSIPSGSKTVN